MVTDSIPLTSGLIQHRFYDGKVVLLEISSTSPQVIDHWAEAVRAIVKECAETGRPYAVAHDIRPVNITRYALQQAYQLNRSISIKLKGRIAVIHNTGILGHLLIRLVQEVTAMLNDHIETRFFTNRDEALVWLGELFRS